MFSDSCNTQINGGQFLQVAGNVTYAGPQATPRNGTAFQVLVAALLHA